MRSDKQDRSALESDLDLLITGRVVLLLLPIREQLRSESRTALAEIVGRVAQDTRFNVASILDNYSINRKRAGRTDD